VKAGSAITAEQVHDLRDGIKLGDVIQAVGTPEQTRDHIIHPVSIVVLHRWRDLHPKVHFIPRCLRSRPIKRAGASTGDAAEQVQGLNEAERGYSNSQQCDQLKDRASNASKTTDNAFALRNTGALRSTATAPCVPTVCMAAPPGQDLAGQPSPASDTILDLQQVSLLNPRLKLVTATGETLYR
jgi:hypothetical protein